MRTSLYSFLVLALVACGSGAKPQAKPADVKAAPPPAHAPKTTAHKTTAHKTTTTSKPKSSTATKPKSTTTTPTKTASRTTTKHKPEVAPRDTTSAGNPLMHGNP